MRKRTAKILKVIAILAVVLGVLYAIGVAVSSAKLRRAYTALEKAGRPMNAGNIIPRALPDAENAGLLYESAILLLKAQPASGEANLPAAQNNLLGYLGDLSGKFITESLDADKRAELEQLLAQDVVSDALSIIEQGAQRRSCRFEHDYTAGINMLMPHLSGLRDIIRILGAKACLEAQAGRPDAAWNLAQTQLRFADALRNEPILISQLVRFASIRLSCQAIQKICEVAPPNEEQYRGVQSLLLDYEDRNALILALDGERLLLGEWAFEALKDGSVKDLSLRADAAGESGIEEGFVRLYGAFKPLSLADHAAYVRIMGEYTESAKLPYSSEEANAIDRRVEQIQSRLHVVTSMIVPAIVRIKQVYWETIAQMRVARAGLTVLQDSKARGAFPQTLEGLKLKDLGDPFSDGPLVYRPAPNGFVLYSIGTDQKDNNGSPKQKNQKTDWDIVWQFPNAGTK
jgi:hypothetical protein